MPNQALHHRIIGFCELYQTMSDHLESEWDINLSDGHCTRTEQQQPPPIPRHVNEPHSIQQLLDDAITAIPFPEKEAYLNAMARCPLDVVLREADPAVFLEFEDHNVWAAAVRMVKYWSWRVHLFGIPMAYESILDIASDTITKTEDSINHTAASYSRKTKNDVGLRDEFRRLVEDRGMFMLPDDDLEGNFILFTQLSCFHLDLDTHSDGNFILRIFFYNCIVMINRQRARIENGINTIDSNMISKACFVNVCVLRRTPNHLVAISANSRDILRDAVPVRFLRVHLICVPQSSKPRWKWLMQNVAETVATIVNGFMKHVTTIVMSHICPTKESIIDILLPFGMTHEIIPTEIGGSLELQTPNQLTKTTSTYSTNAGNVSVEDSDAYYSHLIKNNTNHICRNNTDSTMLHDQQSRSRQPPLSMQRANHRSSNDLIAKAVDQAPVNAKYGYQNALDHCSEDIHNNEANPYVFIEYEGGNVPAGVQRLMKYWSWRVLLFGGGPLAYQSILQRQRNIDHSMLYIPTATRIWNEFCTLVNCNAITILPRTDADGNYVMVVDRSRLVASEVREEEGNRINGSKTVDTTNLLRLFLYNITCIIQNMACKRNTTLQSQSMISTTKASLVILNVIQSSPPSSCDTRNKNLLNGEVLSMLRDILPARLVRIHVLSVTAADTNQVSTTPEYYSIVRNEVLRAVLDIRNDLRNENGIIVIPHIGTPCDLIQQMIPYGIASEMICSLQCFSPWSTSTTINTSGVVQMNSNVQNNNNNSMMIFESSSYEEEVPNNVIFAHNHHPDSTTEIPVLQHRTAINPTTTGTTAFSANNCNNGVPSSPVSSSNLYPNQQQHAIIDYWRSRILSLESRNR